MKSFALIDGQADDESVSAAALHAAVYIIALQDLPRDFCSDNCRTLYQRERDQARNNLLEARRPAMQYEIDDTAATELSPRQRGPELSATPGSLPSPTASYLALALIAQALESIRVDMQDGEPVGVEEVLARITQAKEEGDRLLETRNRQPPAR